MSDQHPAADTPPGSPVAARSAEEPSSAAQRLSFLAEVGRVLSSSLDYQTTLKSVARLAVPTIADYCIVDVVEEDGSIRRVATAHHDPARERLTDALRRFPPMPSRPEGVPKVLRSGKPEIVAEVDEEVLLASVGDPEHLRIVRELGARSYLIVPILAHQRVLGSITVVYAESGRRYGEGDLSFTQELAGHAALAIENARLYRDAQSELAARNQTRGELEQKQSLLQLLLDITTAANEATDFHEALRIALDRVRAHTRWPVGHAYVRKPDGVLESTALWSTDDPERFRTLRETTQSVSFAPGIGLPGRVLATGRAVGVKDLGADPSFLRGHLATDLGVGAAFAFPVVVGSEVTAVLEFFSGRSIDPDARLLEVAEHVGTQLGRVVERERARQAIRESEERWRATFEHAPVGITQVGSDQRFIRVNDAFCRFVGCSREELLGRSMEEVAHPADMEAHRVEFRRLFAGEIDGYSLEKRYLRTDGGVVWGYVTASLLRDASGAPLYQIAIIDDVTEDKAVEAERARLLAREQEARQQAEEAVRTRDEILGIVSHDLKNPIHTIKLAAAMLTDVPLSEAQRAAQLGVISRTTDHMHRLVNGLLDLRRVEAGHGIPVEPRPVEVPLLLGEGCRLFQPQAEAKGIEIVRELPQGCPTVWADPERILQVLWNLTGNAIKFTPEGGRVFVRAREREHDVLFAVTDTGPGIAPEDLEKLFDPFWQAKRTARLGTGLGLPISRAIVEAHGGEIRADSSPGAGATFSFALPRAEAAAS